MKVKDLMAILNQSDPEADVILYEEDRDGYGVIKRTVFVDTAKALWSEGSPIYDENYGEVPSNVSPNTIVVYSFVPAEDLEWPDLSDE